MKKIVRDEVLESSYVAIADDRGNQVTYKELAEKAVEISRYVNTRSLIFVLCDHHSETLAFIYKILYLNIVPLLLPQDMDIELAVRLLERYQPQYIYCNRNHTLSGMYGCTMEFREHALYRTEAPDCPVHPDVALLLSTSGTTGSAKLVKISYDNLYDNAKYGCIHLGIQSGQKALSPLPFHYAYGISFCVWHWHCGATVLTTEKPVISREFQEFYIRERVNNFAATPYTYQILQKLQFWSPEKLDALHFAISSGAQMTEKEQRALISVMKEKFWIGYGQTECIGILLGTNFNENDIKIGSVGRPFDNVKVIKDAETGEMLIESRCVCMGYANTREEIAYGDVNQGLLHTGDVFRQDEEGYIYLMGRLKRYVKVLGKRVSLDDLADYLGNQYPCAEFACTGTDNHICIYHTKLEKDLEDKIRTLLDRNLNIPSKFVFCYALDRLPRESSGKIAYSRLKETDEKNGGEDPKHMQKNML